MLQLERGRRRGNERKGDRYFEQRMDKGNIFLLAARWYGYQQGYCLRLESSPCSLCS